MPGHIFFSRDRVRGALDVRFLYIVLCVALHTNVFSVYEKYEPILSKINWAGGRKG